MNDKVQRQITELSELAEPIQRFLLENYPTPSAVVISHDYVNVVESQMFVPLEVIENTVAETVKKVTQ